MNLSVRSKLIFLASVAIVGIAVLATVAQVETGRVFTSASYANENTVPSLLVLDRASTALATERITFWQIWAQTDPAAVAQLTRDLHDVRSMSDAAYRDYEKLISDEKDRGMLAQDRAADDAYDAVIDQALDLSNRDKKIEARDLIMHGQTVVRAAAVTQMSQTTQRNAANSEELAATSEEMSAQAATLQQAMAFFKLAGSNSATQAKKAAKRGPDRRAKDPVGEGARPAGAAVAGDIALAATAAEAPDDAHFTRF